MLPDTDPDVLTRLVAHVRERTEAPGGRVRPAVILMAYGSPDRLSDVPAYYADIRGGRPIAPEQLDDLVARYRALGIGDGRRDASPLNEVTEETRSALETALGLPVYTGMRHWRPRIADAVEAAVGEGADVLVGLVLAPHYSALSIGKYRALFEDAVAGRVEIAVRRALGRRSGVRRRARAALSRCATGAMRTSSSPRTRFRRGSSPTATPTETS